MDIWVDQKYTVTSERKLFVLHRLYSMTEYIDWRLIIFFPELHLHILLLVSYQKSIRKSLFTSLFSSKTKSPWRKWDLSVWDDPIPEATWSSLLQRHTAPPGKRDACFQVGMIVFVLYCFHFCAVPDNPRQRQAFRESLQHSCGGRDQPANRVW